MRQTTFLFYIIIYFILIILKTPYLKHNYSYYHLCNFEANRVIHYTRKQLNFRVPVWLGTYTYLSTPVGYKYKYRLLRLQFTNSYVLANVTH